MQAADWAGERLASAVGLTDSKFDIYLWQREYLDRQQAEKEANTFILDPTPTDMGPKLNVVPLIEGAKFVNDDQKVRMLKGENWLNFYFHFFGSSAVELLAVNSRICLWRTCLTSGEEFRYDSW